MHYLFPIDGEINPGPPSDMAAIDLFNERLQTQGYWVYANGLAGPNTATIIDLLRRLGCTQSGAAYEKAIELACRSNLAVLVRSNGRIH
jgi:predicted RNA polymerase sigma factor